MKCKLFVVFHSKLHESQYQGDESIYTFAKVGDQPVDIKSDALRSRVLVCKDMEGFVNKGKEWAESEFLISLYETLKLNPNYLCDEKFIGFIQYDHATKSRKGESLNEFIKKLEMNNDSFVGFVPISMEMETQINQVSMDFNRPDKIRGHPICYFQMISDYNQFYKTSHTYQQFIKSPTIYLSSSFVMPIDKFMKMMEFCVWASNKNNINQFDPLRKHRIAGGLMERYYGCWLKLSGLTSVEFQIDEAERF